MTAEHTHHLRRLSARLPRPVQTAVARVLQPEAKWLRIPLGVSLIAGGLLSFLPILGIWMLPLGALLLAEDFPLVRGPTVRAINAAESWWAGTRRPTQRKTRDA